MEQNKSQITVLVTGISGFVGAEVGYQLLNRGYKVRGTVRSLKNEVKLKPIRELHPAAAENLQLVEADLEKQEGWAEAVKGVDYIQHIASPLPFKPPSKREALVAPAVNGTLNVLKAADQQPSVKGVVVTSSSVVYMDGNKLHPGVNVLNEDTLGDDSHVGPYPLSKFRAMQAAWDFVKEKERSFKMAMIHPSGVLGPTRIDVVNTSTAFVQLMLMGKFPAYPAIELPALDNRDCAALHILAMENIDAVNGESFIASNRSITFQELGVTLNDEFGKYGYKIPTAEMSNCMFNFACMINKGMRQLKPLYRKKLDLQNDKIKKALNFDHFIPLRKAVIEMAYELIKRKHVPDKINPK